MALGTAVGAAPKVFAYVALGGSLSNLSAPEVKVAVGVLVVLGVVGLVVARRRMADEAGRRPPPERRTIRTLGTSRRFASTRSSRCASSPR